MSKNVYIFQWAGTTRLQSTAPKPTVCELDGALMKWKKSCRLWLLVEDECWGAERADCDICNGDEHVASNYTKIVFRPVASHVFAGCEGRASGRVLWVPVEVALLTGDLHVFSKQLSERVQILSDRAVVMWRLYTRCISDAGGAAQYYRGLQSMPVPK